MWRWIGLVIGLFKGPLGGALGFWVGLWVDRKLSGSGLFLGGGQQAQTLFQRALFGTLGHLAKADGRVSQHEIAVAEQVMAQLHLNQQQRDEAISNFRLGKSDRYPLESELSAFVELTRRQPHLRRLFVEILLNGALADGTISAPEREVLERAAYTLGIPHQQLDEMIMQRFAHQQTATADNSAPNPYRVLGVQSSASNKEIKQAYRRLMSEYHPDKLSGRDVPTKMREYAHDKVREVRAAYDTIRKQRDFR